MGNPILYTFQVHLNRKAEGTDQYEVIEYKDCTTERIVELRREVWTVGISFQQSPICRELVSPFAIRQVFVITQQHKP